MWRGEGARRRLTSVSRWRSALARLAPYIPFARKAATTKLLRLHIHVDL